MQNYSYANPQPETLLFPDEPIVFAGFWERFAASLIDGLILIIPNLFLQYIAGSTGILLTIVVAWLYAALQESGPSQATIGKKAMGIKVMTVDGNPLNFGQATGRHFGKLISSLILGIGYFMMLWDNNKQTLHDKMAGALVVKK
jgi:uncharacterized RDD family membrane protein YckC